MSIGDALKIAFFVILLLALALAVMNYIQQASQPKPQLVMNIPAGLTYKGSETTAIAGYYCIESINSSNGYSIQLNAQFDNGEWGAQDVYMVTPWGQTGFGENVWPCGYQGCQPVSIKFVPANAPCAWLVIALKNGYAYIGYSLDGRSITWFEEYPVNATYITTTIPGLPLPSGNTGIVLAGYGNGYQAQLGRGTLVYLALYYWNGTGWVPAPVGVNQGLQTGETVNNAWVYASNTCGGVVSWPNAVNETVCPSPPSFKP